MVAPMQSMRSVQMPDSAAARLPWWRAYAACASLPIAAFGMRSIERGAHKLSPRGILTCDRTIVRRLPRVLRRRRRWRAGRSPSLCRRAPPMSRSASSPARSPAASASAFGSRKELECVFERSAAARSSGRTAHRSASGIGVDGVGAVDTTFPPACSPARNYGGRIGRGHRRARRRRQRAARRLEQSIALQPMSAQGSEGLNVAVGVAELQLRSGAERVYPPGFRWRGTSGVSWSDVIR